MDPAAAVDFLVDYEKIPDSDLPAFEPSGIYPHGWKFGQFEGAGRELFRTGKIFGVPAAREADGERGIRIDPAGRRKDSTRAVAAWRLEAANVEGWMAQTCQLAAARARR